MVIKFEKGEVSINVKTTKGYYFFWILEDEVVPLIKRLSQSKDGKVKVADKDYGIDKDVKKFFEIKLDSKEDCKKLSNKLKLEWDYHTGKRDRPGGDKFILPWRRVQE
jgi:hypothetical protein